MTYFHHSQYVVKCADTANSSGIHDTPDFAAVTLEYSFKLREEPTLTYVLLNYDATPDYVDFETIRIVMA